MPAASRSTLRAWLQLLRPPNLFTVPGDPLAGYLIANAGVVEAGSLIWAMVSSVCLYSAGLVMNDLADLAEDRAERPGRPLPSGQVNSGAAWGLTGGLAVLGVGAAGATGSWASLLCAVGVLLAVTIYNFWAKHLTGVGAIVMGLCRSLSVMVGGLAGPLSVDIRGYKLALIPALLAGVYIAAVTNLARHETRAMVPKLARVLPVLTLGFAVVAAWKYAMGSPDRQFALVFLGAALVMGLWMAVKLFRSPAPPLPPMIGAHIRLLLLMQAGLTWLGAPYDLGQAAAVVLVLLWPVSKVVSRRFYAS